MLRGCGFALDVPVERPRSKALFIDRLGRAKKDFYPRSVFGGEIIHQLIRRFLGFFPRYANLLLSGFPRLPHSLLKLLQLNNIGVYSA